MWKRNSESDLFNYAYYDKNTSNVKPQNILGLLCHIYDEQEKEKTVQRQNIGTP